MRKGEILNLKWQDIDFRREIIYLLNTKNGEKREVPMNECLKNTLVKVKRYLGSSYVFHHKDGRPYGNIKNSFSTALKKSSIINFRFHDLRHTFASHLIMSGVDLNTVRELLGHKSMQMTLRYAHLSPSYKKKAVGVLDRNLMDSNMDSKEKIKEKEEKEEFAKLFKYSKLGNIGPLAQPGRASDS